MRPTAGKTVALVVVLGLACACTDGREPHQTPAARDTTTTSAPQERADLAGLEAAGVEAGRSEPSLGEGERFETNPLATNVVAVGSALLAWVDAGDGSDHLDRSTDLGASWEPVELPSASDGLSSHAAYEVGDLAVVIGSRSDVWRGSDGYIWTSDDGVSWRGGPVLAAPPDASLAGSFAQLPDGRLAVPIHRPGRAQAPPQALVTDDGGGSWQPIDCPPAWSTDGGCSPPPIFGGSLWLRDTEVSLDQGATWQPLVITPTTGGAEFGPSQILTAVASPSGGWLGLGYRSEQGMNRFWSVVRSDDGMVWETVLSDPCSGTGSEGVEAVYDEPFPLGEWWLVAHTCFVGWRPQRSELYLLNQDGSNPQRVASTEARGLYFAQPEAVNDAVVVPELAVTGTATFLHLRP